MAFVLSSFNPATSTETTVYPLNLSRVASSTFGGHSQHGQSNSQPRRSHSVDTFLRRSRWFQAFDSASISVAEPSFLRSALVEAIADRCLSPSYIQHLAAAKRRRDILQAGLCYSQTV